MDPCAKPKPRRTETPEASAPCLPPLTPTMDTFFDRGFVALHQEVIDHLVASYGIHSLLPGVLGLNRHFRALAIKALLKPFSKTKVKGQKGIKIRDPWFQYTAGGIGEGEYLKVRLPWSPSLHLRLTPLPSTGLDNGLLSSRRRSRGRRPEVLPQETPS